LASRTLLVSDRSSGSETACHSTDCVFYRKLTVELYWLGQCHRPVMFWSHFVRCRTSYYWNQF